MTTFRLWARAAFDAFTLALVAAVALVTAPLWGSWLAWRRLRDGAWPMFLTASLVLLTTLGALSSTGCGASALDRATTALGAAHALQSGAVNATRREVRDDLREACAGETSPSAIDECVAERTERWRATEAGLDVSADALDTAGVELLAWAERVHADEADPDVAPRTVCARMRDGFEAVAHVIRLLDALGVRMPDGLPTWECGDGTADDDDDDPSPDPSADPADPSPDPSAAPAPSTDPTAPATSGGTP